MPPTATALRTILGAGILAPSAENKHFLKFRLGDDGVRLYSTDTASWAERPHRALLALLACGAVVENIVLAAAQEQQAVAVEWHLPTEADPLMATLRWSGDSSRRDELSGAIANRHTNRHFYSREKASPVSLQRIAAAAAAIEGCRLAWLDAPAQRASALAAMRLAETERFRREQLHEELFSAIRFELGWTKTTDEWLPPGALEVEPPMRRAFAALAHWPLMHALRFAGGPVGMGLRAGYLPAALSPHLGLIVAGRADRHAAANAGRAFQRVWLAATAEGLALQPMAAATVLLHQRPGGGWVDADAQRRIGKLLVGTFQRAAEEPYMLFRLGKAKPPSIVTGRRPLDDYLEPDAVQVHHP